MIVKGRQKDLSEIKCRMKPPKADEHESDKYNAGRRETEILNEKIDVRIARCIQRTLPKRFGR